MGRTDSRYDIAHRTCHVFWDEISYLERQEQQSGMRRPLGLATSYVYDAMRILFRRAETRNPQHP